MPHRNPKMRSCPIYSPPASQKLLTTTYFQFSYITKTHIDLATKNLINIIGVVYLLSNTKTVMTKQDLINAAADASGITKKAAAEALEAMLGTITKSLKKGDNVTITGFGTFRVSKRSARKGVNPRTQKEIKIPAMKLPAFRAGKTLRDAVR